MNMVERSRDQKGVRPKPRASHKKKPTVHAGLLRLAGTMKVEIPAKVDAAVRADLLWLVEHPENNMWAKYHDAAACWDLIEASLAEIRKLRKELARLRQKRAKD
jgi:hypothetical protein